MMRLPKEVRTGDPVRADDYNALIRYVRSLTLQSGLGYRVARSTGGQVLQISGAGRMPKKGAGAFGRERDPFEGSVRSSTKILVAPGHVLYLNGADDTEQLGYLVEEEEVTVSGTGGIWLKCAGHLVQTANVNVPDWGQLETWRMQLDETAGTVTSYTTTAPTVGTLWPTAPASVTYFYAKILEFETSSGVLSITDQIVDDNVYMADSYATHSS